MPKQSRNWPLLIGGTIVLAFLFIALVGPQIAPRNPLERLGALRTPEGFIGPPFPPLTPGYPLGSDRLGRDMFSRLLWGVQPTMIMVLAVACARLAAGVLIGMVAGWAEGRLAAALNALVAAALAVPTLLVALAVIAVVGIERGLVAFIAGLALTGWVETARVVSEQTRLLKRQQFVQAADALGAPGGFILIRHGLRHVAPLLGALLALEISATLMLVVALGFLGYYIGGGVWTVLDGDAIPVAMRVTEYPELGQMLATSLERQLDPRPMVIVGGVIFVAILGFNLLGEGLRRRADRLVAGRETRLSRLARRALAPAEHLAAELALGRGPRRPLLAAGALALATGAGALAWQARPAPEVAAVATPTPVPGAARWGAARGDAAGTLAAPWAGGDTPTRGWSFAGDGGFTGPPAVAADGTLYLGAESGALYAVGPDGVERWRRELAARPFGTPAIGSDGTIYVADAQAGLSAVTPAGEIRWRFQSTARRDGTSGPVVGPDGTIYYTIVDQVQAVTPDGQGRWVSDAADDYLEVAPRVSPAGDLVFLKSIVIDAADGRRIPADFGTSEAEFTDPGFFVGADGATYYRYAHIAVEWRREGETLAQVREASWQAQQATTVYPSDAGATAGRVVWMWYTAGFANTRMVWIDRDGRLRGNLVLPQRSARLIGVGADATAYVCGSGRAGTECVAAVPTSAQPRWSVTLDTRADVIGGAVTADRLYIVTGDGVVHEIVGSVT